MRASKVLAVIGATFAIGIASAAPQPHKDGQKHEGVATCAGSQCHGASSAKEDSAVLQNEYFLWSRDDRHAQAYKTLLNEESKKIGKRLGITPHTDKQCLVCHSDYVPEPMRGKRFRLTDGVGCEGCHGGAENWLESHVERGATHEKNLAAGLYPSEKPADRAAVCLNCHLGGPDHPIDHRIMGAGHPPLSFELDTFTAIEPAHHEIDADYKKRKGDRSSAQIWATGQIASAQRFLQELSSGRAKDGLFPELAFFDCYACHHELTYERWDAETAPGLGVGKVRLHGVNLLMVSQILSVIDKGRLSDWDSAVRKLHSASQQSLSAMQAAAKNAEKLAAGLLSTHAERSYSNKETLAIMRAVANKASTMPDFNYAEQSNMALEALALTLGGSKTLSKSQQKGIRAALDKGYEYTNASDTYRVSAYRDVINSIRRNLPK